MTRDDTAFQLNHPPCPSAMQLTAALSMLSVISVHTFAFSWRRHDSSKSSPDVEFSVLQDLALPGLLRSPRKTGYLFSVSQK